MYPLHWWKSPFFYPIGNSPPALLTRDLAPEENAQILLLGCGDPRSILHTIHAGLDNGNRTLDFTCCDLETAVLARNILLLTMIADGIFWHYTWRIFYHFYLDSDSLRFLLSQCRALTQASADLTTWNASPYGKYIRFCTEQSMIEIRSHWEHYLSVDVLPEPQKRALRNSFSSSMVQTLKIAQKQTGVVSSFRASGPLGSLISCADNNAQNDLFRSFWSTGVMKGRFPHPPASHVNPTFACSLGGKEFNVDLATHLFAAFHLAPVLAQKKRSAHPASAEDLVDAVTTQFSNWCQSFHLRVNAVGPPITIRFFAGDCLLFCKALRKFHTTKVANTGIYARPWGLSQIDFTADASDLESSPAPTIFNIIDTSNLADFLGLLNILLVTVPLLQPRPWSVLHTNTVRSFDRSGHIPTGTLSDKLFSDIPTSSLFLGVTPVSHLSDFSTHSPKDAVWSLSWKYPSSVIANKSAPYPELDQDTRVLVCDELLLGNFLYSVYTQMFAEENIDRVLNPATYQRQNRVQYIRESFVEFLSLIRGRVLVDWTRSLASFLRLADADEKLRLGHRQSYHDLTCQLYLSNVASHNDLQWPVLRDIRGAGDPFEGWDRVPPVVSVTLKVPRERLKILEDINPMELGIPVLICMSDGVHGTNVHSSIRPTFGDVVVTGHHQDTQVVIHDDQAGWQGTSPLIVSFDAPSSIFTAGTEQISLNIRPGQCPSRLLIMKLGNMRLCIFTRPVSDNKNVWITRFRPNESQDICHLDSGDSRPGSMETSARIINVDLHVSARVNSLTLRHTIEDQDIAKILASGEPVSAKAVADTVVLVSFQGYEQLLEFPIPVNGDKLKTRIARKSSYIEIVAPIRQAPTEFRSVGILLNPFPIARTMTSFNLLNIGYINLSQMPALDLSVSKEKLKWLSDYMGLSKATDENHQVVADLKRSISTIFLASSGLQRRSTVFELSNPTIGVYAVIVVNGLRLDLSECQTVVADACVIPLDEESGSKVMETLRRGTQHAVTTIRTLDEEMETWKAFLPAVAESCRTWQHNDRCEYRERGIPACSEDKRASPLCQCGSGKDLGTFASLAAWKEIQSQATRVAIPSLFTFHPPKGNINQDNKIMGRAGGEPDRVAICGNCRRPRQPTLMNCSRCKKASYCSKKCQQAHWKTHKPECNMIVEATEKLARYTKILNL